MASGHTITQHSQIGFYLVAAPKCMDVQLLVNPMTGEHVQVKRSDVMISRNVFYSIKFNRSGMAYLSGSDSKVWVSGLGWKEMVVTDGDGRLAFQEMQTKQKQYVDDHHTIKSRVTRTLDLSSKLSLSFSTFKMERGILQSRLHDEPHTLGGRCFWEFRHLKEGLHLDYEEGNIKLAHTWENRHFHYICNLWKALYDRSGGADPGAHVFPSRNSWDFTQVAQAKAFLSQCMRLWAAVN